MFVGIGLFGMVLTSKLKAVRKNVAWPRGLWRAAQRFYPPPLASLSMTAFTEERSLNRLEKRRFDWQLTANTGQCFRHKKRANT